MKYFLIGLLSFSTLTAYASDVSSCYFGLANERLDTKVAIGISTLGIGTLVDQLIPEMGLSAATELLTEAIAQNDQLAPLYLKEIQDGAFGSKLERIIKNKKDNRLNHLTNKIKKEGFLNKLTEKQAKEVVSNAIVELIQSQELCNKEAKTTRKIRQLVMEKLPLGN